MAVWREIFEIGASLKTGGSARFIDWIGLSRAPDFRKARWLGISLGFAIALLFLAGLLGGVATLFQALAIVLNSGAEPESVRNVGLVLVAIFGAPFVFWRAIVAQKQADTAEQSHITDQINKAVSGLGSERSMNKIGRPVRILTGRFQDVIYQKNSALDFVLPERSVEKDREWGEEFFHSENGGDDNYHSVLKIYVRTWDRVKTVIEWQGKEADVSQDEAIADVGDWAVFSETVPNIEVRTGSIYALERISQDSERDHIQIMEILTAYVRENAPVENWSKTVRTRPRTDIQAALDVIRRRSTQRVALEHSKRYRLDLREVDLCGGDFSEGDFSGALLSASRLDNADFYATDLTGARLGETSLNNAIFIGADLTGSMFDGASITELSPGNISIFQAKSTRGLSMAGADMSAIEFLSTEEKHTPTLADRSTKFGGDIYDDYTSKMGEVKAFHSAIFSGREISDERVKALKESGFLFWSPFKANDLATRWLGIAMRKELGLTEFPFQ